MKVKIILFYILFIWFFVSLSTASQDDESSYAHGFGSGIDLNPDIVLELDDSFLCHMCSRFTQAIQDILTSEKMYNFLYNLLEFICPIIEPKVYCEGLNGFANVFLQNVLQKAMNSTLFCVRMRFCDDFTIDYLSNEEYKDTILNETKVYNLYPSDDNASSLTIAQINDIHVDLDYQAGTKISCALGLCCRTASGNATKDEEKAGYFGSLAACDVPLRTVESAIKYIANDIDPDILFWLGDNNSNNLWEQKEETRLESTVIITNIIKEYVNSTKVAIYPILGNHEAYPPDQLDIFKNYSSLYKEVSGLWYNWLNAEALLMLKTKGYYTTMHRNTNLRIIALNPFLYDVVNLRTILNSTDPWGQLVFLRKTLDLAEKSGNYVYILGHIPTCCSFANSDYGYRYNVLIERYSHIIKGQFYGHQHMDYYTLNRRFNDSYPIGIEFAPPSLTTHTELNPSFRTFDISPKNFSIIDYTQYRLYLDEVNVSLKPDWKIAYKAKEFYCLSEISPPEFERVFSSILTNQTMYEKLVNMTYSEGPIAAAKQKDRKNKEKNRLYCYFTTSYAAKYQECMPYNAFTTYDIMMYVIQKFQTSWAILKLNFEK